MACCGEWDLGCGGGRPESKAVSNWKWPSEWATGVVIERGWSGRHNSGLEMECWSFTRWSTAPLSVRARSETSLR